MSKRKKITDAAFDARICKGEPRCFGCGKEIRDCCGEEAWDMPSGASKFNGGWNFGSRLYDAAYDGVQVEIMVCDECLETKRD
jgi:hypothetical protein